MKFRLTNFCLNDNEIILFELFGLEIKGLEKV